MAAAPLVMPRPALSPLEIFRGPKATILLPSLADRIVYAYKLATVVTRLIHDPRSSLNNNYTHTEIDSCLLTSSLVAIVFILVYVHTEVIYFSC